MLCVVVFCVLKLMVLVSACSLYLVIGGLYLGIDPRKKAYELNILGTHALVVCVRKHWFREGYITLFSAIWPVICSTSSRSASSVLIMLR